MVAVASELEQRSGGVSRRDFLRFGGLGVLGLTAAEQRARAEADGKGMRRCIFIMMTGGASHLETFDPKPAAPAEYRGPFKAIPTAVPGVHFADTLPLLAQRADKFSVIRSLTHDAAPLHETSQQLLLSGRLASGSILPPSVGSMVARLLGSANDMPAYAVLPNVLGDTGVNMWQGQRSGELGVDFEPWQAIIADAAESAVAAPVTRAGAAANWSAEPESHRRDYGDSDFAHWCLAARRMVEQGTRFVTVNMFDSLPERITWDCHANPEFAPATLADYRNILCPDFDRVVSALLDDLENRGLLEDTLVVATGEFGRTPRINANGGRDHWTNVWSALVAGGGIPGGQVVGASDARGMFPAERPVSPAELAATVLHSLGVDLTARLTMPSGTEIALADAGPIEELVGGAVSPAAESVASA
ncbi:MAG: DUF1501 domain-containing protein [Planctomycetes bacterium]|nr:DUF1501 domain-containing protein [Planctomycetota bacterium]